MNGAEHVPLHPTDPKYSQEAVAARMAEKHDRIRAAMQNHSRLQAAAAGQRLARGELAQDQSRHGFFIINHALPEVPVERTPFNDQLFWHNPATERFEVIKQGSAVIVNLLRINETIGAEQAPKTGRPEAKRLASYMSEELGLLRRGLAEAANLWREPAPNERRLALFDNRAVFHDDLLLTSVELLETRGGPKGPAKHVAHFQPAETAEGETPAAWSIAIDDIHCLGPAKPKPRRQETDEQKKSLMLVQLHLEEVPGPPKQDKSNGL